MRSIAQTSRIAFVLLLLSLAANAQVEWKGSYTFAEDGGKNAGGTAVMIFHELDISDGDEGLIASLRSNGYQTSSDLICSAKAEGAKVMVFFHSYGDDNMFEPYKQGDLLFTLEQKIVKGKPVILTHWGKFTPAIPKNAKSGKVYFERNPENKL